MKYLFLAALGLFLFGCKQEDPIHYYPVTPERLDFYNYKVGSYWIMEDGYTHVRDSFAVVDIKKSTTNYSSYGQVKEQIVFVIKDYPLWQTADPKTWLLVLQDEQAASLQLQSDDGLHNRAYFPRLLSPPLMSTAPEYQQGGKTFENSYETNTYDISHENPMVPDTMYLTSVFNKESGIIRLKTAINPEYNYDWQVVESKIIR